MSFAVSQITDMCIVGSTLYFNKKNHKKTKQSKTKKTNEATKTIKPRQSGHRLIPPQGASVRKALQCMLKHSKNV